MTLLNIIYKDVLYRGYAYITYKVLTMQIFNILRIYSIHYRYEIYIIYIHIYYTKYILHI